jgi:hypothetical protein
MYSFEIDCPNEGLGRVMQALRTDGIITDSRNGPVIRFPKPVCLEYSNPRRRVLDHPVRDANHFFHLIETMWMFAGLNTVAPLDLFNEQFKQYSDDGKTFAAPYGFRWRHHFKMDQLQYVVDKLRKNPEDRRIVLQIWDPEELKKPSGKDFACNQNIMFDTRPAGPGFTGGYFLDMTVTNRSNDLIYGAMGSNLFHMSMLHEYIAHHAGLALGTYYQFSKNMHLYLENPVSKRCWQRMDEFSEGQNEFESPEQDRSLSEYGLTLDMNPLKNFVNSHVVPDSEAGTYLDRVVKPIVEAYKIYKLKRRIGLDTPIELRVDLAIEILNECKSEALRSACIDWLTDKVHKAKEKRKAA